jgi:Methyltransferase domain
VDALAPRWAERTYRIADGIARRPWRNEVTALPAPVQIDGRVVDVIDDLVAYTDLPPETVRELLMRRRPISFRSEWYATALELRRDHWFYLSSKYYMFGNAIHFPSPEIVERFLVPHASAGDAVLDFGGGVGTLATMLAAAGFEATVTELNALQRDFIRFRVHRNALEHGVQVLDPWDELGRERFDAVIAMDVLEHIEDGRRVVAERILPSLRKRALIVENSLFGANVSNPMHHPDWGLDRQLGEVGFSVVQRGEDGTRAWIRE